MINFKKISNKYKKFSNKDELKDFLKDTYGDFFNTLTESEISNILSSHSHGLNISDEFDLNIIRIIENVLLNIPPIPCDVVLFRGDDDNNYKNKLRPWLAHSFLKTTAKNFTSKNKIYTVYIPAGSKILPTCFLNAPGAFTEEEVILETKKLKKIWPHSFIYKDA